MQKKAKWRRVKLNNGVVTVHATLDSRGQVKDWRVTGPPKEKARFVLCMDAALTLERLIRRPLTIYPRGRVR